MSHSASRRSSKSSNKGNYRFVGWVVYQEFSCFFLGCATNLTNQDNSFSFRIVSESRNNIDKVCSVKWISSNSNASTLSQIRGSCLCNSFVCQSSRSRDNTDFSWLVNMTRHNSDLTSIWFNDSWAVWTDKTSFILLHQSILDLNHILLRNSFCNANYEFDFSFQSFHDSFCCEWSWNIDDRSIGTSLGHSFFNRIEHRKIQVSLSSFSWRNTTHHLSSIINSLLTMESSLFSCESLTNYFRICIYKNCRTISREKSSTSRESLARESKTRQHQQAASSPGF
mmetsp:Transcript_18497/g.23443  ORF Transcript_18497/g.23443 Transcript_18497/m.23443 type:complete len:282 (-) Transcript_18497:2-847(-)